MSSFDFANTPYQYYYMKSIKSGKINPYLPSGMGLELMQDYSESIMDDFFEAKNKSLAKNTFLGLLGNYVSKQVEEEKSFLQQILGQEQYKIYSKAKNDGEKIRMLTSLYFTGNIDASFLDKNSDNRLISKENMPAPEDCFLLAASSNMITKKMQDVTIDMGRGRMLKEIQQQISPLFGNVSDKIFKQVSKKLSMEKDKLFEKVFSSPIGNIRLETVNGLSMPFDDDGEEIKKILQSALKYGTKKTKIKDYINQRGLRQQERMKLIVELASENIISSRISSITNLKTDKNLSFTLAEISAIPNIDMWLSELYIAIENMALDSKTESNGNALSLQGFKIFFRSEQDFLYFKTIAAEYLLKNTQTIKEKICEKTYDSSGNVFYIPQVNLSSSSGALGEIISRLGAEKLFNRLKSVNINLGGIKRSSLGTQSFSDVQASYGNKEEQKNIGLNVKHYTKPLIKYEERTYSIFEDYLTLYIPKEIVLGMRYLELNYNYFVNKKYKNYDSQEMLQGFDDDLVSRIPISKGGSGKGLQTIYQRIAILYTQNFIRQSSLMEDVVNRQNYFYILNNLVIPASIVFKKIIEVLKTDTNKSLFKAKSSPAKTPEREYGKENYKTVIDDTGYNRLNEDLNNTQYRTKANIAFRGISFSTQALSHFNDPLKISVLK